MPNAKPDNPPPHQLLPVSFALAPLSRFQGPALNRSNCKGWLTDCEWLVGEKFRRPSGFPRKPTEQPASYFPIIISPAVVPTPSINVTEADTAHARHKIRKWFRRRRRTGRKERERKKKAKRKSVSEKKKETRKSYWWKAIVTGRRAGSLFTRAYITLQFLSCRHTDTSIYSGDVGGDNNSKQLCMCI